MIDTSLAQQKTEMKRAYSRLEIRNCYRLLLQDSAADFADTSLPSQHLKAPAAPIFHSHRSSTTTTTTRCSKGLPQAIDKIPVLNKDARDTKLKDAMEPRKGPFQTSCDDVFVIDGVGVGGRDDPGGGREPVHVTTGILSIGKPIKGRKPASDFRHACFDVGHQLGQTARDLQVPDRAGVPSPDLLLEEAHQK